MRAMGEFLVMCIAHHLRKIVAYFTETENGLLVQAIVAWTEISVHGTKNLPWAEDKLSEARLTANILGRSDICLC